MGPWLRLLAILLSVGEPVTFAATAAASFNAIAVRGTPVVLVLLARMAAAALSVAAGRALLDARPTGVTLAKAALAASAGTRLFSDLTTYFPSNRLPGQAPYYAGLTIAYYGAWLIYLLLSKRVSAMR